jgi:hypothetical protein
MVVGAVPGCIDDDTEVEYEWGEPNEMKAVNISVDRDNLEFDLRIKFWDEDGNLTRWSGELRVAVIGWDDEEVFNLTFNVKSDKFKSPKGGDKTDTWLDLSLKFDDFTHISDLWLEDPGLYLDILLSFHYKDGSLETVKFWKEPTEVYVEETSVNETAETVGIKVALYDKEINITKWGGDLRLIIWDSRDFEMYNASREVQPQDFLAKDEDGVVSVWYDATIDYEDIAKSKDRPLPISPWTGTKMRAFSWFSFRGKELTQGPLDAVVWERRITIPDGLLLENEAPVPDFIITGTGYAGEVLAFDASGSTDDTSISLYKWSWGDGTSEETGSPVINHRYDVVGTYELVLTVRDIEGEEAEFGYSIDIQPNITVSYSSSGIVTNPGERHNNTWWKVVVTNVAPFTVDLAIPEPILFDEGGNVSSHNGTEGTFLSSLDEGGEMTLTFYFAYIPAGEDLPVEFMGKWMAVWGIAVITPDIILWG